MAKDTTVEGELKELIEKRVGYHNLRPERYYLEELWLIEMAYWSGKQRIFFEEGRFWDAVIDTSPEDVSYQINLIRSRVMNAVAMILDVNPQFRVKPVTGSARDRELAKLSDKVFDHLRNTTDFQYTLFLSTLWKAICGTSFIKVSWDPTLGEPERYYMKDKRTQAVIPEWLLSQDMRAQKDLVGEFEDYKTGDLRATCVSPFSVYCDSSARDGGILDAKWLAERHWMDIDTIAERWDVDPGDLQPMEHDQGLRNYEESIAFMSKGTGLYPMWTPRPPDKQSKRTLYVEMWERPTRQYPRGRRIVYAGGKILNKDRAGGLDNPYAGDRTGWAHIPYIKDDWAPHPGRFWGASLVEDMLAPQFYLNIARSQSMKFMLTFGLPNTFVGDQAGLDTDNMAAGGGKIYKVNEVSSFKVQHGPTPQMPPDIALFGSTCESDLNKVAAQSEIEGSSLPGQLRSGSAVRQINEERFRPLSVPAKATVRTTRDCGRTMLAIGKLYYGKNRLMRYLGEDNEWVVDSFDGANLVTDIEIIGEPSVMDTLSAERAEMLDAIQAGAFNPQLDEESRMLILKGLHYNTSDEFIRRKLQAERNQEREIQEMIADPLRYGDQGYPVMEWEDHVTEAASCIAYMYTPEFKRLDPQVQAVITHHWKQHQMFIQQALQAQMQMQAAMKGTPGQKGQASQPTP